MPKGLKQTIPLRWYVTGTGVIRAKYRSNDPVLDRSEPATLKLSRKIGFEEYVAVNVQARR